MWKDGMQGGDRVCNYIYIKAGGNQIINIDKIEKIPGVIGIEWNTIGWTMMVESDGRRPEEVLEDIKKIVPVEEHKILHGK